MISFSRLGNHGRIGNQLFQVAATISIAERNNAQYSFPAWQYADYFETNLPASHSFYGKQIKESNFHYDEYNLSPGQDYDLLGYFQSEKYFRKNVKEVFKFNTKFLQTVKEKLPNNGKKNIAIHIRRGDYQKEPYRNLYYQLPVTYFIDSLLQIEDWQDYNLVIFSDDLAYCKLHFECAGAYFPELNEIETLAAGTFCEHFIISNSTFGWWLAYLGEKGNSKVIHPGHYFTGRLAEENDIKDFWPERWTENKKDKYILDISDITFTIPVFCDSLDRKKNLDLCVCVLQNNFKTNIIVGEQGGNKFRYMSQWCEYTQFINMRYFHRTRMLNQMCLQANTPFIANWDCDVIITPFQIYMSVLSLRSGKDIVFPYDGRFARWDRNMWFKKIEKTLDIGCTAGIKPRGHRGADIEGQTSVGGAVFVNKESFIKAGMENENMISFGPEDCERNDRFSMLGLSIERIPGYLHHINHWIGPDSSTRNPYFRSNHAELNLIRRMNKSQLQSYINTWQWCKGTDKRYFTKKL